jgi:hypothetical protein
MVEKEIYNADLRSPLKTVDNNRATVNPRGTRPEST